MILPMISAISQVVPHVASPGSYPFFLQQTITLEHACVVCSSLNVMITSLKLTIIY
jgi:hypothetical protein